LNKQNVFFFPKNREDRKVKQGLSGGWYQLEGGGYKERVWEDECDGHIMFSCMKMEK
jgi:hypothetical protein